MINILFYLIFLVGLALTVSVAYVRASPKSCSAVSKKKNYGLDSKMKSLFLVLSGKLNKYVRLSSHKQDNLRKMLLVVGDKRSPTEFTSDILTMSLLILIGMLLSPFIPILAVIFPILAGTNYWYENRKLETKYKTIKRSIESDLPKLCSVIGAMLNQTSVVMHILETFLPVANPQMKKELDYTLADMKISNVEEALLRFEGRITSSKLSDVVRGLISVSNGDDQVVYFQSKQYELNQDYRTIKKRDICMRSEKLTPTMIALAFIFFTLVGYPMTIAFSMYQNNF